MLIFAEKAKRNYEEIYSYFFKISKLSSFTTIHYSFKKSIYYNFPTSFRFDPKNETCVSKYLTKKKVKGFDSLSIMNRNLFQVEPKKFILAFLKYCFYSF